MEIDNSRIAPLSVSAKDQGASVDKHGKDSGNHVPAPAAGNTADRVSLTGDALRLRELETEIATLPVVDSQRVDAVRNAIDKGIFVVNAERIAEKLMSLENAITDIR